MADSYRRLQQSYREDALAAADKDAEIDQYMASRRQIFKLFSYWRMAREKKEGTWQGSWAETQEDNALIRFAEAGDDAEK